MKRSVIIGHLAAGLLWFAVAGSGAGVYAETGGPVPCATNTSPGKTLLGDDYDGVSPEWRKLCNRWFGVTVKALQTRMNEEAAYTELNPPGKEEWARLFAADEKCPDRKISELVDPKIYSSLQHQMKSKWLVPLLREGQLLPRKGSYWNNDEGDSLPGVYLELHRTDAPKPFAWGDVELHFDYSLLDRGDYILNPYWDYGAYTPVSASPMVSHGRVAYYLRATLLKAERNEVVFLNPVPLDGLKAIIVKKGLRAALLKELKKSGISCRRPGGCEALISERP